MADAAREQRLRELFDRAVDLPPAERERLLAGLDDELLAERLAALLRHDQQGTAPMLQRTPADALLHLRRIGNHELLRELGRGGMGTVMLARQVEPVERLVALKLLERADASPLLVAHFEQERQTLASLDHPGIARLYDGGDDGGTLWFAMEYVRGESITAYCDRRRLDLRARLRLFAEVCAAIQHAHQHAIVHRDLKPANVLVTEVGGAPQAKVIDFGVARAPVAAPGQRPMVDEGVVLGTRGHMSPEQADPRGQGVDTRTDIYALGVLLHTLLVGALPQTDGATASAALAALEPGEQERRAALRQTSGSSLVAALRGELDAILSTALATDRNDRYASASELRQDVLRHLRGEPVAAMPDTMRYRVAAFVRRHRTVVAVGGLALLGLVGTAVGSTIAWAQLARVHDVEQRADARQQRQLAQANAQAAIFELVVLYGDPGTGARPPSLREVLERLQPTIAQRFAGRRLEEAAVREVLGRAWLAAGEPQKAEAELLRAWSLTEADADPLQSFVLLHHLVRATRKARGAAAARAHQASMLDLGVRALTPVAPGLATTCADLAARCRAPGDDGEFLRRFDRALADVGARPVGDPALRIAGPLLALLAIAVQEDGQTFAGGVHQRIEAALRQALGDDVELPLLLGRYAEQLLNAGAFADAQRLAREVGTSLERMRFGDHWLVLRAARLAGLAQTLGGDEGDGEAALQALDEQLAELPKAANEQAGLAARCLAELATRLSALGRSAAFCKGSAARWQQASVASVDTAPWWPAATDGVPRSFLADALAALDALPGAATSPVRQACRGALLLRLGRTADAIAELEAAAAASAPSADLLADLAIAHAAADRRADAERDLARLNEQATGATARQRHAIARARAALGR